MMKKVLVGLFLAAFGIAMTNVTLAATNDVMCTMQYDPVCWVDNQTYGNACVAGAEGVAIKHAGECTAEDTQKACTKEYNPVCGEKPVVCVKAPCFPVSETYGNKCMAEADGATNIQPGACDTQSKRLAGTAWELTTFNGEPVEGQSTLTFEKDRFGAKVCNHIGGEYTVNGSTINVSGVISTLMFCTGKLGDYETAFDLQGARFEFATDGGNHLMITTQNGDEFQWKSTKNNGQGKPVQPVSWKRYGLIIWQLNQLAKLNGYDTVAEKQEMAQGLIDKINYLMAVSLMTPLQNMKIVHLKKGVQFYHDHVGEGLFDNF